MKIRLIQLAESLDDSDVILAVVSQIANTSPKLLGPLLEQHPSALRLWSAHVRQVEGNGTDSVSWTAARTVFLQAHDTKGSAMALLRLAFAVKEVHQP